MIGDGGRAKGRGATAFTLCERMKTLQLLVVSLILGFDVSAAAEVETPQSGPSAEVEVKVALDHPFRIFLTDEVLLTHHSGSGSAVSHWTKQIQSAGNIDRKYRDSFAARVLENGFLEVTNGDEVLLIPMEKVVAIRLERRHTTKNAEQGGAGRPATSPESDSEGGDKPKPEAEGPSR